MAKTWKRETKLLLSSDEEDDNGPSTSSNGLAINKDYASRYEAWRGKEEIQKYKDKFGTASFEQGGNESDSESSSESESELVAIVNDKHFLKTLSCLKEKDPIIYDSNLKFFPEPEASTKTDEKSKKNELRKKKEEKKPFLLKDHERKMILEGGLQDSDEESDQAAKNEIPQTLSYHQELNNIRKGISAAVKDIESEDDDDESDLLKQRQKSTNEVKEEEDAYNKWLKGQVDKLEGTTSKKDEKELKYLRDYWNDPKLADGEQFLRDYILNKKYIDEGKDDYKPSYDEIVHDSDEGGLSADECGLQEMEEFEQKYNFRFEEPDPEFIKKYPRTVENSIRRKENKRKVERERLRDTKQKEKDKKLADMQQLKAFSRKQILEKIRKLQQTGGDPGLKFSEEDLEKDFDPDEYDSRANQIFNDEFYSNCVDTQKPVFSDMELDDDDEEDATTTIKTEIESADGLDSDEGISALVYKYSGDKDTDDEEGVNNGTSKPTRKKKGRKGKRFLETLEKESSKLKPDQHKKLQEEYYKLDFEDIIGDIPCRFKYREVVPNDFGLTTDEILQAPDTELNRWSSIKKTYQYRSNEEEMYDRHAYEVKRGDVNKKKRLLASLYSEEADLDSEDESNAATGSKKKRRKKNSNQAANNETKPSKSSNKKTTATTTKATATDSNSTTNEKKKRKRKKNKTSGTFENSNTSKSTNSIPSSASTTTSTPSTSGAGNTKAKNKNKNKNGKTPGGKRPSTTSTTTSAAAVSVKPDRLQAYGINPKKYEKWVKYGGNSATTVAKK